MKRSRTLICGGLIGMALITVTLGEVVATETSWRSEYASRLTASERAGLDSPLEAEIELFINQIRKHGFKHRGRYRKLERSDKTSITVYDLVNDTKLVSINEGSPRMAASLVKLYVMLLYYDRVAAGEVRHTNDNITWLRKMIRDSSNHATNRIIRILGGPAAANNLLRSRYPQYPHTTIVEYIPSNGRTYRNKTSASDLNRFFVDYWNDKLPHTAKMKILMGLENADRFVDRTYIPNSAQVYDKTGSVYGLCGDSGIVSYRDPKTGKRLAYAISVLIEDRSKTSHHQRKLSYTTWIGYRSRVIRKISQLVFGYLHKEQFGYEHPQCRSPGG